MLGEIVGALMWAWLKDIDNERVLGILGAAIAFVWTAGWGVFVYIRPPRSTDPARQPSTPGHDRPNRRQKPAGFSFSLRGVPFRIWALGIVALAVAGGGWRLYVTYFVGKQETYYLCMGSYKQYCGSADWVPCHTDMTAYVKNKHSDICVYIKPTKLSDVSGNECGYATYKYDCSTVEK